MKKVLRYALWCLLGLAVLLCIGLEWRSSPKGISRLEQLPLRGLGFVGQEVALTPVESTVFQKARVIKRLYQAGRNQFVLLAVDGSQDRHPLHDPFYCFRGAGWSVSSEATVPLLGGSGRHLHLAKEKQTAEATSWFSDGRHGHASALEAWWQSARRRLGLNSTTGEPVLVLVQPLGATAFDWPDLWRRCPFLLAI